MTFDSNVKAQDPVKTKENPRTHRKKTWTKTKNGLFGLQISRTRTNNRLPSQTENYAEQGSPSATAKKAIHLSSSYRPTKRKLSSGGGTGEIEREYCWIRRD